MPNGLDPVLELLDASGSRIAFDDNSSADGRNATIAFTAPASGTFRVRVAAAAGSGVYVFAIEDLPPPRVVGRYHKG